MQCCAANEGFLKTVRWQLPIQFYQVLVLHVLRRANRKLRRWDHVSNVICSVSSVIVSNLCLRDLCFHFSMSETYLSFQRGTVRILPLTYSVVVDYYFYSMPH